MHQQENKQPISFSWDEITKLTCDQFTKHFGYLLDPPNVKLMVWGIPRGGIHIAQILCAQYVQLEMASSVEEADIIVDDLIDSGATAERYVAANPNRYFFAPIIKGGSELEGCWLTFPWESEEKQPAEDNVRRLLQLIGEDPNREGLLETPKRFIKALKELCSGYGENPSEHLTKSFDVKDADAAVGAYDELILSGPLPFVSLCEHHMALFEGHAWIGYIPSAEHGRVVGLSKLGRLLDGYAKRLQVQERLTLQIANDIQNILKPEGVAVVIRARHTCQCARGIKKDGRMVTSALRGVFKDNAAARSEFMQLITLTE